MLISSKLFQNVVKITELPLRIEFEELVQNGGCMKIETELQRFLHEQELLQNEEEVRTSLGKLREVMNQTLHLTMIPTEGCNFRCPYCYENHVPAFIYEADWTAKRCKAGNAAFQNLLCRIS